MEHACVPGSSTTPGRPSACVGALGHIAFRYTDSVGTRNQFSIAAQWLACTFPCRRFAGILAGACARLGANVDRYSFIAADFHRLLLAGLPAHKQSITRYFYRFVEGEGPGTTRRISGICAITAEISLRQTFRRRADTQTLRRTKASFLLEHRPGKAVVRWQGTKPRRSLLPAELPIA